ncbi:hypothetical protein NP511_15845 [Natrinema thermotolerans]|uniref:DUF8055 domain-containing protein n=1 Tax=Natrinema thermotolerans TaxID=121872 RepID=A0AAF0PAD3_9EURY|nr:hypothetical protein [Natrinema thermotolerans]ELZ12982.1 hypothetical protein C478_08683 [Natrinema thermotolerans DSM 11552]QCC59859.1 hypothetical protein DVR14_14965 [Natrinema thermotolerans]WMT06851.1 hypothetical protein NP511_15845 [Natrinema thermotolerans]
MSRYGPRIAALARRAERERAALDGDDRSPTASNRSPAPGDADAYLRDGVGPAVWLYVEGRTGGRTVPFTEAELAALETAMNRWLECYTRCHGVDLEAAFTVREAAELLLETRNVVDTAQLLTRVPERDRASPPTG